MKTLHLMVIRAFIPGFVFALVFFSLILQLADIFGNIVRYLNLEVSLIEIAKVQLLYIPKTISYSLPVALLFAIAFTLGTLYGNNELISVFGSGISLYRLIIPFLLFGMALSIGGFLFEENVVIQTYREKNSLSRQLLRQRTSYSNTDVTVLSDNGRIIYQVEYYNDSTQTLSGVLILVRDEGGRFLQRIDAESATWNDGSWEIRQGRLFYWNEENPVPGPEPVLTEKSIDRYSDPILSEPPETFRNSTRNVEEMSSTEAREWIESMKRSGFPVQAALTEYYKRFSFAFTPFIVAFISSAIGGRFKKNILLMSLLLSLVISVVYYVAQMIAIILAKLNYIPPVSGAWAAFVLFLFLGFFLFRSART